MSTHETNILGSDRLDHATRARLAKLSAAPVDTSRLEQRLRRAMAAETGAEPRRLTIPFYRQSQALSGLAAAVVFAVLVGVIVMTLGSSAVQASPEDMVRLHEQLVLQGPTAIPATDMEQVRQKIAEQWDHAPSMPNAPSEHVMACCISKVKDRKVATVLLDQGNKKVTMAVAKSTDLRLPDGAEEYRGGQRFVKQRVGRINTVMTIRDGSYICLMGELPVNELVNLAAGMKF